MNNMGPVARGRSVMTTWPHIVSAGHHINVTLVAIGHWEISTQEDVTQM